MKKLSEIVCESRYKTIEDEIKAYIQSNADKSWNSINKAIEKFADEIISSDNCFWELRKRWKSYGTWKIEPFFNEYHFGEDVAELLRDVCKTTTHDEDKEYELKDFEEEIYEELYWWAKNYYDDREWELEQ